MNTTQKKLPMLAPMRHPVRVPSHIVSLCQTSADALLLAIRFGGKTSAYVAAALDMPRSQLSRIIGGSHHFPADRAVDLAYVVGNWGWTQWVAHDAGFDIALRAESAEEKVLRLEAENAELRAVA